MTRNDLKNKSISIALFVILIFTLLTLADAPAPGPAIPVGLCSLEQEDNILYVNEMDGVFCSEDGGLTWIKCHYAGEFSEEYELKDFPKVVSIPDSQTQYRITRFGRIQVSLDGGKSWQKLSGAFNTSEAFSLTISQAYFPNANNQRFGAQDILYDANSGNVIITLQSQGAVVIKPDHSIHPVTIGENQPQTLSNPEVFIGLLIPYLLFSVALMILYLGTIILFSINAIYRIQIMAGLGLWFFLASSFTDLFEGYSFFIGIPAIFIAAILFFSTGSSTWKELRNSKRNKKVFILKLLTHTIPGGLAYFLCYILWYVNIIPYLQWAAHISFAIALLWFIYCMFLSNQWHNPQKDSA